MININNNELLFNKGDYLMVSIDYLPISLVLDEIFNNVFITNKKYHITIAFEPKKIDEHKCFLNYLNKEVIVKTKSISIGDKGIARIDIDYMKYLDGVELKRINDGCSHITLIIPSSYKPKDAGFFEPNRIIEFDEVLIGIYELYQN